MGRSRTRSRRRIASTGPAESTKVAVSRYDRPTFTNKRYSEERSRGLQSAIQAGGGLAGHASVAEFHPIPSVHNYNEHTAFAVVS